jgi:hypothetical protein
MTLIEALDIVVARTGHSPYRELCSEANTDAQQRDAYRRLVYELAGSAPDALPSPPVVARPEIRRMLAVMKWGLRSCLYSSHEGCGCSGTHCYHLGRAVTLPDCLECLNMKGKA